MGRGQDDEQVICQRMQRARDELSHFADFDYMIVNDDFDEAARDLEAIIVAHRLKMGKQCIKLRELLSFLMS
jgi:guanylate kinase